MEKYTAHFKGIIQSPRKNIREAHVCTRTHKKVYFRILFSGIINAKGEQPGMIAK